MSRIAVFAQIGSMNMALQANAELAEMADEMVELIKVASTARARARAGKPEELTEAEFLTLDALVQHGPQSVGDVQKRIGVLPAQMSRIIRSLENKGGEAFVSCNINPNDRRKIDVSVAPKGKNAHAAYRSLRHGFALEVLRGLVPDDRKQLMRILHHIREEISRRLNGK